MFEPSAAFYDAIYSSVKDYPREAQEVARLLREAAPQCRTVLDAACGTGEHAHLLQRDYGFQVDGFDLEPAMLEIASEKNQGRRFELADMVSVDFGGKYDAVVSLFGAIGYLRST